MIYTKKGIDVSYWQGTIEFSKVKDSIDFIILRSSKRREVDGRFHEYVKGCTEHGIHILGVYHFIYALNEAQALEEAKICVNEVRKAGLENIYIFADFEYDSVKKAAMAGIALDKTACNRFTEIFCEYVESQGYKAGIYANIDFYKHWYEKSLLDRYPVWLADYAGEADYPCFIRQYTSTGKVDGIEGCVDMDYMNEEVIKMPNYASTVIAIAEAEVGYLEKKSNKSLDSKTANAGSANYTKYGRDMHKLYPSVMDFPAAWCDAFVDWCFQTAYGVSNAKGLLGGDFNDYTPSSAQLYKNKGAWGNTPKIGAQIFFINGKRICHTGLVYNFDKTYVYTIEGNTSGASGVVANGGGVCKKKYKLTNSKIAGYGYPKYDTEPTTSVEKPVEKESTKKVSDTPMPTIEKGSTGNAVKIWQIIVGFTGDDVDGNFGTKTKTKTKAFQKKHGLEQDGVVGPLTWKAGLESV